MSFLLVSIAALFLAISVLLVSVAVLFASIAALFLPISVLLVPISVLFWVIFVVAVAISAVVATPVAATVIVLVVASLVTEILGPATILSPSLIVSACTPQIPPTRNIPTNKALLNPLAEVEIDFNRGLPFALPPFFANSDTTSY